MTNNTDDALSDSIQTYHSSGLLKRLKERFLGDNPMPFVAGSSCCGSSINMADSFVSECLHAIDQVKSHEADLLVVHGVLTKAQVPYLKELYENLQEPKKVVAFGTCATSGAIFDSIALEEIIPVDFHVPGCPPTTSAFIATLERFKVLYQESRTI